MACQSNQRRMIAAGLAGSGPKEERANREGKSGAVVVFASSSTDAGHFWNFGCPRQSHPFREALGQKTLADEGRLRAVPEEEQADAVVVRRRRRDTAHGFVRAEWWCQRLVVVGGTLGRGALGPKWSGVPAVSAHWWLARALYGAALQQPLELDCDSRWRAQFVILDAAPFVSRFHHFPVSRRGGRRQSAGELLLGVLSLRHKHTPALRGAAWTRQSARV